VHKTTPVMKTMVSTGGCGVSGTSPGNSDVLLRGLKAGPWVVEYELGRGGMGAVYAVVHEEIGKRAALKVVHQRLVVPGFNTDRMLQEAKVVNQVGHPNIVDIFETGQLDDGRPYIVMERLAGRALSVRADECKLLPDFVIAVLLQVCDALIAAHTAGIVHRDLKLDNVFLVDNPEDPTTPKVKLLDWGIAKVISQDAKHTIEGQLVGTPQYLAPEQARGQAVSSKTDVYSLGVMAYELFLEQPPFEAETAAEVIAMHLRAPPPPPSELWPDIPPVLNDLLLAMLAKLPSQRPTMREVIRQLEDARGELERRCQPPTSRYPTATPVEALIPNLGPQASAAPAGPSVWRPRTKRWSYAIGAVALAASAMVFLSSRADGQSASAATKLDGNRAAEIDGRVALPPANLLGVGATSQVPQPILSDVASDFRGRFRPAAEPAAVSTQLLRSASPAGAGAIVTRTTLTPVAPAPRARTTPAHATTSTTSRATPTHTSSVSPYRGIKSDPDGTLDPYR
jgi:serine/threonine protein kinase